MKIQNGRQLSCSCYNMQEMHKDTLQNVTTGHKAILDEPSMVYLFPEEKQKTLACQLTSQPKFGWTLSRAKGNVFPLG